MEGFKKFYVKVIEWKTWACMFFTATVIIYMAVSFFTGGENISLSTLLGLLIVSTGATFVQFLCFTDNIIKKLKYSLRLLLFVVLYFPFLAGCAFLFKWFPTQYAGAWIMFGAIFIVFFVVFTICFEIYFKFTGKKYDGILGQYIKEREKNK